MLFLLIPYLFGLVILAIGTSMCFFGYRFLKWFFAFYGFMFGSIIGYNLFSAEQSASYPGLPGVVAIIIGIVCSYIAYRLRIVGYFFIGYSGAEYFVSMFAGLISVDVPRPLLIILSVIGGIIALQYQKPVIVVATSMTGAFLMTGAVVCYLSFPFNFMLLFSIFDPALAASGIKAITEIFYIIFGLEILLSVIGALTQFKVTAKKYE